MTVNGKIYGFPDDGDVFILYYRKDILGDPEIQAAFKAKYGTDLPVPPTTWKEFDEVGPVHHRDHRRQALRRRLLPRAALRQFMFQERFRNEGGKFFDADTMKATINSDAGVKVFTDLLAENKWMPPGVENWGFVENLAAFLQGETAMTISWPPYGRWAAGYGTDEEALSLGAEVAPSPARSAMPCRRAAIRELAAGFCAAIAPASKNKEAAYLFIQWLNSEEISLERVQLPYALRDPFRDSHFTSAEYKSPLAGCAKEYLAALQAGASDGLLDLSLLQTDKYEEVLRQGVSQAVGRRGPEGDPRRRPRRSGTRSPRRSASTSRRRSTRTGRRSRAPIRSNACNFPRYDA